MFLRVFALAVLAAIVIDTSDLARPQTSSSPIVELSPPTAGPETVLPNGCEVLAAQAYARLRSAGIWTRILIVSYEDGGAHALCVFQPAWQICVYDDTGTVDLATNSHHPDEIANLLAIRKEWKIVSARFLK